MISASYMFFYFESNHPSSNLHRSQFKYLKTIESFRHLILTIWKIFVKSLHIVSIFIISTDITIKYILITFPVNSLEYSIFNSKFQAFYYLIIFC